jgi:tRNA (guanine-N7-)-methyltransferase
LMSPAVSPEVSPEPSPDARHRDIRSFVLRTGRLTRAQDRAMRELWPRFGVEAGNTHIDLDTLYPRKQPVVLEIGFGNGNALAEYSDADRSKNYLGAEVHTPGVGQLLLAIEAQQLPHVRVFKADAVELLKRQVPDAALAEVRIWFPDPWHKTRHNKRRIVQPAFLELLASKLIPGGLLHLATDWQPYAEHMLATLRASPHFGNTQSAADYAQRPSWRPLTHFEKRGHRLGHGVWDLIFARR